MNPIYFEVRGSGSRSVWPLAEKRFPINNLRTLGSRDTHSQTCLTMFSGAAIYHNLGQNMFDHGLWDHGQAYLTMVIRWLCYMNIHGQTCIHGWPCPERRQYTTAWIMFDHGSTMVHTQSTLFFKHGWSCLKHGQTCFNLGYFTGES